MALASSIIAQAFALAGNASLSTSDGLNWLQNFLDAEYARKYPWQRLAVSIAFTSGVVVNTANWNATFLDFIENFDGSVGVWADASGNLTKVWGLSPAQYVTLPDRNTATGPPRRLVADRVLSSWYVYPKTDQAYTITAQIARKPVALALSDTPLWSTYAPDGILVQAVKVAALEYMDDARYNGEYAKLYGDQGKGLPGMLAMYRRREFAKEGVQHQSALAPQVFRPMPVDMDWIGTT